jgi:hypothetical protein
MRKKKSDIAKSEERPISLGEALMKHKPFSQKEADALTKKIVRFYDKLRKEYGAERFDLYTSTMQAIAYPDGIISNIRGNMHTATYPMAAAINLLVRETSSALRLTRESVLLSCITDIAEEVRKPWTNEPSPLPNPPYEKPSIGGTKVPITPVE